MLATLLFGQALGQGAQFFQPVVQLPGTFPRGPGVSQGFVPSLERVPLPTVPRVAPLEATSQRAARPGSGGSAALSQVAYGSAPILLLVASLASARAIATASVLPSSKTPAPPKSIQSIKPLAGLVVNQRAVGRRVALIGAGALAFAPYSAAWAKGASPKTTKADEVILKKGIRAGEDFKTSNLVLQTTFEQCEKLVLSALGWGDAEVKVLSKALPPNSATRSIKLDGNNITDAGVAALATSLNAGAASKLASINLSGNSGVSEAAVKSLKEAREGLKVQFEQTTGTKKGAVQATASNGPFDEKALYKFVFETSEVFLFSELDWGDAEAKALAQELPKAKTLKKLFLNGNAIQCDGGQAIAASIRSGGAPNLKLINLAGNRGLTEADRRAITTARSGIEVNFVQLKKKSDAEVYIRADQGKLTTKGVINRASEDNLVDGSAATCSELKQIINVDREALKVEKNLLSAMKDPVQLQKTKDIEQRIEKQVERLDKLLEAKGVKGCKDDRARLAKSTGYPLNGVPR
jgi:hypothetical protein